MRRLNEKQVKVIQVKYGKIADLVIRKVEEIKLEDNFEALVDFAVDMVIENGR